jgi:hypothetical protein
MTKNELIEELESIRYIMKNDVKFIDILTHYLLEQIFTNTPDKWESLNNLAQSIKSIKRLKK